MGFGWRHRNLRPCTHYPAALLPVRRNADARLRFHSERSFSSRRSRIKLRLRGCPRALPRGQCELVSTFWRTWNSEAACLWRSKAPRIQGLTPGCPSTTTSDPTWVRTDNAAMIGATNRSAPPNRNRTRPTPAARFLSRRTPTSKAAAARVALDFRDPQDHPLPGGITLKIQKRGVRIQLTPGFCRRSRTRATRILDLSGDVCHGWESAR